MAALRLERGWSQAEMAYRTGLSVSAISMAELGKADPNLRNFLAIVETLAQTDGAAGASKSKGAGSLTDFLLGRDGH